jgi:class 3 adenylate cyclase
MPQTEMAVLFADIAGSTKLYDTLGDTQAKVMIDECLNLMRGIIARYSGRVVKTIGDELMVVLPNADSGFLAATDMQTRIDALPAVSGVKRAIRIGFHAGPVIEESNDVFGDTVNMAARMAGLAKGMQIITTQNTVKQLSASLRESTRDIAALSVKGKGDDVEVCEVIWQDSGDLTMATPSIRVPQAQISLVLSHGGRELILEQANSVLLLGRDASCQIVLADRMASRVHARIERRRDKFFVVDQSTNGTFVSIAGDPEISLRREEAMLRGQGRITFGHSISQSSEETVDFTLRF